MDNVLQIGLPGGVEWIVIIGLIIIILIFGSKKIPELAKSLGRASGEFKKGKAEVEKEIDKVDTEKTEREKLEKIAKDLGISIEDKSDEELRQLIKKALG